MRVPLLDHGYIELVESWGSDQRIVEAARMSTDKGFLGWGPIDDGFCETCGGDGYERLPADAFRPGGDTIVCRVCKGSRRRTKPGDEKLLRYLWENAHATPFEMVGLTIEVQAPIFVFREWHRHRVPFGYNELSARYTPMPNLNYVPTVERCMVGNDGKNKQAGTVAGAERLTESSAQDWLAALANFYDRAEEMYQMGLRVGVPKELARVAVPVGRYSRMRATGNLRGWLGFMKLRAASKAQYEIRVFAEQVGVLVEQCFPRTWEIAKGGLGL